MKLSSASKLSALSGVLAAMMAFIVVVIAGYAQSDYSHRLDLVSELNAAGSNYPGLTGYLGFIPVGLVTLFFVWRLKEVLVASRRVAVGLFFVALVGTDWLVTALAPCDAGCPASGNISLSQKVHSISGLLTMLLMPLGLIKPLEQAGFSKRVIAASVAAIGVNALSFLLIASTATENMGLVQRIGTSAFYIYLGLLSIETYQRLAAVGGRALAEREAT